MISYRKADILDKYRRKEKLQGHDLIGKTVTVRDPNDNDLWDHSFDGRVTKFYEATRPICYEVEDQEGNSFTVERGDFDVLED